MSFSVEWSKAAAKQLLKIPKKQRLIILSWIQDYLDEFEHYRLWPCAKAIQGSESGWRSRLGVYRILGRFEGRKALAWRIEVDKVGQRSMKKLDKQIAEKILTDRGDIHRSGTRFGLDAFFEANEAGAHDGLADKTRNPLTGIAQVRSVQSGIPTSTYTNMPLMA